MGKIIEGRWNCNYCGTKDIRGGIRVCPSCGKARDVNNKIRLPHKKEYVPEEEAKKINRNPDWECEFCNHFNSDDDKECKFCGAERNSENLNYFEAMQREREKAENKKRRKLDEETKNNENREATTEDIDQKKKENNGITEIVTQNENQQKIDHSFLANFFKGFVILLIVVLLFNGLISLFLPKEKELKVTEMSWERNIEIERYQTVFENDWHLPTGARLRYTREEFSHYDQVIDHYETKTKTVTKERFSHYDISTYTRDLGNGYFEEEEIKTPVYETYNDTETYQEPVYKDVAIYKTKYYYDIDKWLFERNVKTTGQDKNPYWGETNLAEDERVSDKTEMYKIKGINEKEKEENVNLSYDQWEEIEKGQTLKFKVSIFGNGEVIK